VPTRIYGSGAKPSLKNWVHIAWLKNSSDEGGTRIVQAPWPRKGPLDHHKHNIYDNIQGRSLGSGSNSRLRGRVGENEESRPNRGNLPRRHSVDYGCRRGKTSISVRENEGNRRASHTYHDVEQAIGLEETLTRPKIGPLPCKKRDRNENWERKREIKSQARLITGSTAEYEGQKKGDSVPRGTFDVDGKDRVAATRDRWTGGTRMKAPCPKEHAVKPLRKKITALVRRIRTLTLTHQGVCEREKRGVSITSTREKLEGAPDFGRALRTKMTSHMKGLSMQGKNVWKS